jgi:hypothetical protein
VCVVAGPPQTHVADLKKYAKTCTSEETIKQWLLEFADIPAVVGKVVEPSASKGATPAGTAEGAASATAAAAGKATAAASAAAAAAVVAAGKAVAAAASAASGLYSTFEVEDLPVYERICKAFQVHSR